MFLLPLLLALTTSAAPGRQPQLASSGSNVAMVYGDGHAILLRHSSDDGRTFSAPSVIAESKALALGRHRGPRVVFSGSAMIVSAVSGTVVASGEHAHGLPADGDLRAWRSVDGGMTWSKPVVVNDVPGASREGLHAMAADSSGNVAAVWLDLRAKGTRLYGAFSNDAGATWSKNILVYESPDGTICQCCDPSIVASGNAGEFTVMWRNAMAGNRDLYSLRLRDGKLASKAEKMGTGSWELSACPMDGGGLAMDHGHAVSAWRREDHVYATDASGAETELGAGKDVAMAVGHRGLYVAWVSADGVEIRKPGAAHAERLAAGGAFPALVALGDGSILAAWEQSGGIVTQRVE